MLLLCSLISYLFSYYATLRYKWNCYNVLCRRRVKGKVNLTEERNDNRITEENIKVTNYANCENKEIEKKNNKTEENITKKT